MNYPKEFYVTNAFPGDKVWLDVDRFYSGKKAFHGPWWVKSIHQMGVTLRRENGPDAIVDLSEILRMSKSEIKKMAVLPSKPT
jgi:hypothetical protein